MGYRSTVTLAFYTRHQEVVPFAALKLWFDENYPHKEATTEWEARIETGDDWITVEYLDVKWYPGYTHVVEVNKAIESFVSTFEANDTDNVAYEYVRIGEETEDIEEDRSGYCDYRLGVYCDYRLGVSREICFD